MRAEPGYPAGREVVRGRADPLGIGDSRIRVQIVNRPAREHTGPAQIQPLVRCSRKAATLPARRPVRVRLRFPRFPRADQITVAASPRDRGLRGARRDLRARAVGHRRPRKARARPGLVHRHLLAADFGDQLNFHRCVQRQLGHPDRAAGMPAGLAEHLEEQLAGPVDDLRLAVETRCAGHEPGDLDDAADSVQATGRRRGGGQRVEGADPGQGGRIEHADLAADLAHGGQFPVYHRQLTRGIDELARSHRGHVRASRSGHGRQGKAQFSQPRGRTHGFSRFR